MTIAQTTTDPIRRVLDYFGDSAKSTGSNQWQAPCPAHPDRIPSLSIGVGDDGVVKLHCHAGCETTDVVRQIGLTMADLFPKNTSPSSSARRVNGERRIRETYNYEDTFGVLLFQVVRFADPKDFRQRRPDGDGGWVWNLQGVERVLYRLQELTRAPDHAVIYIVEGERDADRLHSVGMIATCNSGGAGKWKHTDDTPLHGRHVAVIPDNEPAGHEHAQDVARRLHGKASSVRIVKLPGLPEHGDVSDWLDAGNDPADLDELAVQAPEWEPGPTVTVTAAETNIEPDGGQHLTELGNAGRLIAQHGRDLLYCDPWARWLIWDGRRWKADEGRRIEALAVETVKSIYGEAADESNTARRKALAAWAQRCETTHHVKQIITLAKHRVPVVPDELDTDPWKFNVLNGTLDLHTGELRKHDRANLISKLSPVEYDADAECPRWEQFLSIVLAGNEQLIGFLQRMAGYSLTGDIRERCLFILYGGGFNGKTVFLETLREVFGSYALRTPAETLLAKRGDTIPNDIARLKGARFVTASETEDNRRFAEAFVKDLTGGDTITARFMRAEYFEFRPECKIVLATNHRPVVRGTDDAIWARLRIVPFTVTIPEQDRDPQLRDKLIAESAGILAWALRGCLAWQRSGLGSPDEVTAAMQVYRSDMDVLGVFIDDCCELQSEAVTPASDLYQAYKQWADRAGERPLTQRAFGLRLKERGLNNSERMPGTRRKAWGGISLTNEFGVERDP